MIGWGRGERDESGKWKRSGGVLSDFFFFFFFFLTEICSLLFSLLGLSFTFSLFFFFNIKN